MKLTEHFYLAEFAATSHREIDNTPSDSVINNLRMLAVFLESIRDLLDAPIIITSGYRCPDLNAAVGGSRGSRHMLGLAADFIAPGFGTPIEVCSELLNHRDLVFDQLIFERTWIHIGLAQKGDEPRKEVLTLIGPGSYSRGLVQT